MAEIEHRTVDSSNLTFSKTHRFSDELFHSVQCSLYTDTEDGDNMECLEGTDDNSNTAEYDA